MATKKVQIGIQVDKKGATKGYKKFADDVSKQNKKMRAELAKTKAASSGLGVGIKGLVAAAGGLFIFSKINSLIRESVTLAGEQASAEAKVEQTIRATGQAAGITADEMKKMATEFQNVTTFGDEVILRGQSMLLTFKKIGKDVFPAATEAMLNLSIAMNTDVKEAAIQLGKALNDPITGLTALRRVGITFSKEQENVIKNFQKTGDIASAQKLILQELESQFGGLAKAVALTGSGPLVQFGNIVGDVKELLGDALIPVLLEATAGFKDFLVEGKKTGSLKAVFEGIADSARFLFAIISDAFRGVQAIFKLVAAGITALATGFFAGLEGITRATSAVVDFFGGTGSRMSNELKAFADDYAELADRGVEGTKELVASASASVGEGSKIVASFKRIAAGAKEAKKELADIKGAAGVDDVTGGDAGDSKKKKAEKGPLLGPAGDQASINLAKQIAEEKKRIAEDVLAFEQIQVDGAAKMKEEAHQRDLNRIEELKSARRAAGADFVSNLGAIAGAQKKFGALYKAAAITQTTIDTFTGATAAFKSLAGIPLVGPILGAAAAAAAVGAGLARVAQIKAQKFAGGGVAGGQQSGDRVPILVNGGEMVLTASQQRNLFALANGKGGGGRSVNFSGNIVINSGSGDPDEIAQAVNRTMQERLRQFSDIQNEKDALLVT